MKKKIFLFLIFFILGVCIAFPKDRIPYNYRFLEGHIHAGGHPLNPANNFGNSDAEVLKTLEFLKARGVKVIIDLENTRRIQARYQRLLDQAGIKRLHMPMHSLKVPNPKEWAEIKQALNGTAYVHCKWGADRTGAVLGRYLVEDKGYSPKDAYSAVITGGAWAGPQGGLKKGLIYQKLKDFIYAR